MLAPEHVASKRKALKVTQQKLAQQAGVSQSLIAKIERGLVKPTYAVMQKIDFALSQHRQDHGLKAKDFAQHRPVFCSPNDTLKKVIQLMSKHEFSQVPVREQEIVGLLTEQEIFKGISTGNTFVRDVMLPPPPILHGSASEELVFSLLEHVPLIIVQEGRSFSVITKADVFNKYRNVL